MWDRASGQVVKRLEGHTSEYIYGIAVNPSDPLEIVSYGGDSVLLQVLDCSV